jgi:hypothetical protein
MFYKSNFIKNCFSILTFLFIVFLIFKINFPHEAFAMEPPHNFVTDYYGKQVYVGPDAYTYFNDPAKINTTPAIMANPDIIQNDSYGTSAPFEEDWYANKKTTDYMHSGKTIPNKYSNMYQYIRRISFYYLWKIHSSEYIGYKDFKKSWDPSSSIRKEILKDIKSEFKFRNK